ncbi:endonuclease/exonuclease/phosphatase family protein [Nonomuraea fuscirosea]|uniref:endonuclease/exonuclease/phosphatase family protein n=1 Tax=Nonomuraea fuscirosea TaxID=1291556 RepID=UPI002DDA764A|nr:endonuclease/exonuclease/phosphatase family protein [Nonomuraea fuscirosea]WSA55399.1 endonuclease/exonuclease/phosphatase family protein [Nonomuraea fuscirosea]
MNEAEPYGPLIGTRVRVLTWNVWGKSGPYARRAKVIEKVVREHDPDVVTLQEWAGQTLGYEHVTSYGEGGGTEEAEDAGSAQGAVGAQDAGGAESAGDAEGAKGAKNPEGAKSAEGAACAVLSRWPITRREERRLPGGDLPGSALFCELAGPRGPLQVFSVIIGAYRLDESGARQEQVRALTAFVGEVASRRRPALVCGDFNAGPDSDEIRMLTGRTVPPTPGVVFYDAWEVAGDGGPGHTWCDANPWARPGLYPPRRFDYVLSAWPRAGGAGHPVRCEVVGNGPDPGSDHYAVLAELRY